MLGLVFGGYKFACTTSVLTVTFQRFVDDELIV